MTLAALAELALRSSILLGGTWLAAAVLQALRGSAASRHAVWMLGFATIVSLPLLVGLLPPLPLPVLPANPEVLLLQPPLSAAAAAPAGADTSGFDPLLLVYFSVTMLLVARLALGRILLERMWQKAGPANHCRLEVRRICETLGIRRRVEIRTAQEAIVPMTWGSISPRVLLPREALAWSSERLHSVLLHELGHVVRHDSTGSLLAQSICALYWANPLAWLAVRQMHLAQEQACDDLVLSNGGTAADYARDLLESACALSPRMAVASVAMASRTDLEKRLRSILREGCRSRLSRIFVTVAGSFAAVTGALAATIVPVAIEQTVSFQTNGTHPATVRFAPEHVGLASEAEQPAAPQSRIAKHPRIVRTPVIRAALSVPPAAEPVDPMVRYHAEVAAYRLAVDRYREELRIYHRKCDEYRSDLETYRRDLATYRRALAAIGPNDVIPAAPTAPVAPVAPVTPVVPVVPPIPST